MFVITFNDGTKARLMRERKYRPGITEVMLQFSTGEIRYGYVYSSLPDKIVMY